MKKYLFSIVVLLTITNKVFSQCPNPTIVSVSINDPGQTCSGTPVTLTADVTGGGVNPIYQWYLGTTPVGTNSSTYTIASTMIDDNKQVTVKVTSSDACTGGPATSNPVTLDIVQSSLPTVNIQTNSNPNCAGFINSFSITNQTGTGNAPTYKWYVNGSPAATGPTFASLVVVDGDQVWVEMTSTLACLINTNPYTSNKITLNIKPIPYPTIIEGDKILCAPQTFTFTSSVGTGTILQWKKNGVQIPGATNSTYVTTQSGQYSITEDNGTCNQTSAPVTLSIDPCGAFSTFIAGSNPVRRGEQNLVYSVPNQTAFEYEWVVTGGTIVSGQGTSAITVDWNPSTTTSPYTVSVIETNANNQKKTLTMYVSPTATSVTTSLAHSGITLFPNPATESFNIEMPKSDVAVSYEIVDLTGASVATGNFISSGSAEKIVTNFGAGMYQIVLRYNGVVTTGRLNKVQ